MDMTMESCRKFVEVLASDAPAPGGGGAAALVGTIGTALGNMVGSLTVGKKKYADVEEEIIALKAKCDSLQKELLDQIAAEFYISKYYLSHCFKAATGFSVGQYLINTRILEARRMLQDGGRVAQVGEAVGFHSSEHFIRTFTKLTGISPKQYARQFSGVDKQQDRLSGRKGVRRLCQKMGRLMHQNAGNAVLDKRRVSKIFSSNNGQANFVLCISDSLLDRDSLRRALSPYKSGF